MTERPPELLDDVAPCPPFVSSEHLIDAPEQPATEPILSDELLELVEQLPLVPLTPVEEVFVFAVDELLLQLYAFATFGVIVGAKIIAKTLAVEMAIAINIP